jgi:hypothetical protein
MLIEVIIYAKLVYMKNQNSRNEWYMDQWQYKSKAKIIKT